MKIIKIPITEQNREVYWYRNKDKKAWEKLMSECPSMTSKEFWKVASRAPATSTSETWFGR